MEDDNEIEGLRQILDRIHQQTVEQEKQVEEVVEQISKRQEDYHRGETSAGGPERSKGVDSRSSA